MGQFEILLPSSPEILPPQVEIGTLQASSRVVVFLVFNTIARSINPPKQYKDSIRRVVVM